MSPTLGRLAAFIIAASVFAAAPVSSSNSDSKAGSLLSTRDGARQNTWTDPVPGTKPLFGLQERILDVGRRDCLANGSNYCFGNNVDFCPSCGNCCVDGKHCCGGGKVCCGMGCCSSDQVCSQGKCVPSVEPVTITSTITQTLTRTATQRATVVVAEIQTSTSISTVDITLSTAATRTDIVWVTATTVARRAVASPRISLPSTRGVLTGLSSLRTRPSRLWKSVKNGLPHIFRHAPNPRQEYQGAAPVVTSYVTQTTEVTSITSVIITTHTTSTDLTIVYQTSTHVLKTEATVTITSTLTLTSRPPSVVTVTTTANLVIPTNSQLTPTPSTAPDPGPPQLPIPTIAGIAAGSSAFALLLAGLIITLTLRRRRRRRARSETPTLFSYDPPYPDTNLDETHYTSTSPRTSTGKTHSPHTSHSHRTRHQFHHHQQPTLPSVSAPVPVVLPHFVTTTAPAHHAAEFKLPPSLSLPKHQPPASLCHNAAGQGRFHHPHPQTQSQVPGQQGPGQSQWRMGSHHHHRRHHQRNSSGLTTLVGTPSPTAAVFGLDSTKNDEGRGLHHFQLSQEGDAQVVELGGDGIVGELGGGEEIDR